MSDKLLTIFSLTISNSDDFQAVSYTHLYGLLYSNDAPDDVFRFVSETEKLVCNINI